MVVRILGDARMLILGGLPLLRRDARASDGMLAVEQRVGGMPCWNALLLAWQLVRPKWPWATWGTEKWNADYTVKMPIPRDSSK